MCANDRIAEAMSAQRSSGNPVKIVVSKPRDVHHDHRWILEMYKRACVIENHQVALCAPDHDEAVVLFGMAQCCNETMCLKEPLLHAHHFMSIEWDAPHRSRIQVYDMNRLGLGKGQVIHDLYCTGVSRWHKPRKQMLSLLNAVPMKPGNMVVVELDSGNHGEMGEWWDDIVSWHSANPEDYFGWIPLDFSREVACLT